MSYNIIDPHVHCRDQGWAYKETIAHAFEIAERYSIHTLFDMPNNYPLTINAKTLEARLKLVPKKYQGRYFIYMGLTSDPEQIKEAVRCYYMYKEVIGLKMFACHSVGNLSVPKKEKQAVVYNWLEMLGFEGVLPVHCEEESLMNPKKWDSVRPSTHDEARPPVSAIASTRQQINLALEWKFPGTLHIPHISTPEEVELVKDARKYMRITCGVTPHHLLWSKSKMNGMHGLLYKMNPPLRNHQRVKKLRQHLVDGNIDWIESDHAPHQLCEKLDPPHISGYPSHRLYPLLLNELLPSIGVTAEQIKKLTHDNIKEVFGI